MFEIIIGLLVVAAIVAIPWIASKVLKTKETDTEDSQW